MNAGNPRSSNPSNPHNPTRTQSAGTPQASQARTPQRTPDRGNEPTEPAYEAPPKEHRSAPAAKPNRAPTHVAYHVREIPGRKEKKAIWTRIGGAWPHHDGKGFNIQIEVVPLDGKITLRVAEDQRDK
jgi:hypothetical protein